MRYRHLRRTVIAVLALTALLLLAAVLARRLLDTPFARRTVVQWLANGARQRGVELSIEELRWGFVPPRLKLSGVSMTSGGLHAHIDEAELDLARIRLAGREVELGTVAARGVRVRLDGLPEGRQAAEPSALKLSVRNLELNDLSFEGSGLPGKITLGLEGVSTAWATDEGQSRGFLAVERVLFAAPGLEPIEVSLRTRMVIGDGIELPSWAIDGDGISLTGSGKLSESEVTAVVDGTVELSKLDRVVRARDRLSGKVRVQARVDSAATELVGIEMQSDHIEAAGFPVDRLRGTLTVESDGLHGRLEEGRFHGGRLRGSYRLDHLRGPTRPHHVQVQADEVSLAAFLDNLKVPAADLAARFALDAELHWDGKAIRRGRGLGIAHLQPVAGGLPVAGRIDTELSPEGLLLFAAENLELGRSVVDWQGPLTVGSWEPAWSVRASPAALEEIVPLVNAWVKRTVLPESVEGTGELLVELSGPWKQLAVSARLDAQPLRLPPIELDRVVAEASISGSKLRLTSTRFQIGDGHGEVEGSLGWGRKAGDNQLDISIRGRRIPINSVASWIDQDGRADGLLSFTGGLRGAIASPRGSWAVGFDDAYLMAQPLGDGAATVDLALGRFDARAIEFEGGLEGGLWWDVGRAEIGGRLQWPSMPLAAFGEHAARLAGDTADVALDFVLPRDGPPTGSLDAVCPDARVEARATRKGLTLQAQLADAAALRVELDQRTGEALEGFGELRLLTAEGLLSRLLPESQLPLVGSANATFHVVWPNGRTPRLSGELGEFELVLDDRPIRLLDPATFSLSEEGLEVDGLYLGLDEDEVFARWSIDAEGSLSGNVAGTLNALLLRVLLPEWEPAGRATGVIELLGTIGRPRFEGIAEISQGSFRLPGSQTILSGIDGTVLLSEGEVAIDGAEFRFMRGRGRCSGRITGRDGSIVLALDGSMSDLRYTVLPGLVAALSGSWRLIGPTSRLELSGDITVDRASLQRKDDLANIMLDWFGDEPSPPGSGGIRLDLHVEADQSIEIRNPSVRLVGTASLDISGSSEQPGLVGKMEFEEGGELTLQTVRYELEHGRLTFADPERIDPFVEIQARTRVQNYEITVRLTGTADRLIPSVSSNPPLPEEEVYSLLAMGYRSDMLGSGAMGVGFASSIISRELTSELDRRAGLVLPIDQVRVDPFTETATGNPAARVTVVQQLSPAWTVVLQSNLSAQRQEVVVSRWYLSPGLFVEASRDIDGTYGVDLKLRKQY